LPRTGGAPMRAERTLARTEFHVKPPM